MTQLTIRRLSRTVIDRLKRRASAAGHSMEEEARRILSDTVPMRDECLRQIESWALRKAEALR